MQNILAKITLESLLEDFDDAAKIDETMLHLANG